MSVNVFKIDNIAKYKVGETSTDINNNVIIYVRTLVDLPKNTYFSISSEFIVIANPDGIYRTFQTIPANNYFWALDESATKVGGISTLNFNNNSEVKWAVALDGVPDGANNTGSNLTISRYDNSGSLIDTPILIKRETGEVMISGNVTIAGDLIVSGTSTEAAQATSVPIAKVAVTGNYTDLLNIPKIPNRLSHLKNDLTESVTGGAATNADTRLAAVATTGNFNDLNNIPAPVDISNKADIIYVDKKINDITNIINLSTSFAVGKADIVNLTNIINSRLNNKPDKDHFDTKLNNFTTTVTNAVNAKVDKEYVNTHIATLAAQCASKADANHVNDNFINLKTDLMSKVDHNHVNSKLDGVERTTNKNVANGYAGLDSDGKVSPSVLPTPVVQKSVTEFSFDVTFLNGAPTSFQNVPAGWTVSTLSPGVVQIINNLGYPIAGSIWGPTSDANTWSQRIIGTSDTYFSYKIDEPGALYINGVQESILVMIGTAKIKLSYIV